MAVRDRTRGRELKISIHGQEEEERASERGIKERKGGGEKRKDDETTLGQDGMSSYSEQLESGGRCGGGFLGNGTKVGSRVWLHLA